MHRMFLRALLSGAILVLQLPLSAANVDIVDFGAVADGKSLNTESIQKAINACAESGGGIVTVPAGVFVTGEINLRSDVELYLDRGATLRGSLRIPEDYPHRALVYAENIENAGISGYGTIDGQSDHAYYERFEVNDGKRPLGVFFNGCRRISVLGIRITNAGSWTLRLKRCDGVRIDGVNIYCLEQGNNDGIDVDARNVTIANCIISSDDDGICLKSDMADFMVENVTVTNCIVASNCNPIKLGTSSYAGFRNITVSNCVIRRTEKSVVWDWSKEYDKVPEGVCTGLSGLAVECVDGGRIENVSFSNIVMEGVITPIFVCLNHRHGTGGSIRNLRFCNITAKAEGIIPCLVSGVPDARIEGIVMRDITVEHAGGERPMAERLRENTDGYPENRMYGRKNPAGGLYIRHAGDILIDNFKVSQRERDYRPAVVLDDVTGLRISGLKAENTEAARMVETVECSGIEIVGD